MRYRYRARKGLSAPMAVLLAAVVGIRAVAAETTHELPENRILSIELPVVAEGEESPFNFILDPQGLLAETGAVLYGGGVVDEGATLLFFNKEGEYTFSRYSDKLTVTNRSGISVRLTVSVKLEELGNMTIAEDDIFTSEDGCEIYLALVDDTGREQPVSSGGEASFSLETAAESYSFGLTGACNPLTDWKDMEVHPVVTVTWRVELLDDVLLDASEEREETQEVSQDAGEGDDTVSGNVPKVEEMDNMSMTAPNVSGNEGVQG